MRRPIRMLLKWDNVSQTELGTQFDTQQKQLKLESEIELTAR